MRDQLGSGDDALLLTVELNEIFIPILLLLPTKQRLTWFGLASSSVQEK